MGECGDRKSFGAQHHEEPPLQDERIAAQAIDVRVGYHITQCQVTESHSSTVPWRLRNSSSDSSQDMLQNLHGTDERRC